MKHYIFLAGLAFILTGCAQTTNKVTYYSTTPAETESSASANQPSMTPPTQLNEDLSQTYSNAIIKTSVGDIEVAFYSESPITVNNFLNLAKEGFYNDTLFHRVIPNFMIQGGDPNSKNADRSTHGIGGPGYKFQDEINTHKLVRGSLAMANAGPNTNGSQFFIVTAKETAWLDGMHTNFGYVVSGMDVVEKIEKVQTDSNDHPLEDIKIESIELKTK